MYFVFLFVFFVFVVVKFEKLLDFFRLNVFVILIWRLFVLVFKFNFLLFVEVGCCFEIFFFLLELRIICFGMVFLDFNGVFCFFSVLVVVYFKLFIIFVIILYCMFCLYIWCFWIVYIFFMCICFYMCFIKFFLKFDL